MSAPKAMYCMEERIPMAMPRSRMGNQRATVVTPRFRVITWAIA